MKSKAGDTIAFLTLDDRSARFEVSLFAKEYEKYRELIQKDLILIVECTITVDDYTGRVRGRAKQVMTLGQARKRFAHRLALSLKSEGLETGFCEHLASILAPYKKSSVEQEASTASKSFPSPSETLEGEQNRAQEGCSVVVNYQRPGSRGCIMLGQDWIILPTDDLLQLLRMEYGKDQVELDYKQTTSLN
jgi:DNA polymerase-3 subunit alpha